MNTKKLIHRKSFWMTAIIFPILGIFLFLWWGLGTILPRYSELPVTHYPEFPSASPKDTITVASYNIAHAQGIKADPIDWRDEPYTRKKLDELGEVIRNLEADLVFLQEVDINSDRTHNIDQADYLIRAGHFPYSACAIVWDKNYIPFPFWPIEKHLGKVQTANCVLSKYPISWHKRIIFEKPTSNPFWYNWGYLDRGAHRINVKVGNESLTVVNLHLEAYEQEARQKQAKYLRKWIAKMQGPIVVGGDFNSIPRDAKIKDGFIDEPGISFATDNTIENVKKGLGDFSEALAGPCEKSESLCYTFPSDQPTRRLDHIFAARGATIIEGRVFHEAKLASDHLPVVAKLRLKEEKSYRSIP